jgi:hypothetical protein
VLDAAVRHLRRIYRAKRRVGSMNYSEERKDFSSRLHIALSDRGLSTSPSALTRLFNFYAPEDTMSLTGVRKWLIGETIPRRRRIAVLAQITGVHAAWLQYGEGHRSGINVDVTTFSLEGQRWAIELSHLLPQYIALVTELVKSLLELQQSSDNA